MIRLLADPDLVALADAMVNDDAQRLWLLQFTADHWGMDALDPNGIAVQSILPQFFGSADQPDALAAIRAWTASLFDSLHEQDKLVDSGALDGMEVPVSIIFGESDRYLSPSLARRDRRAVHRPVSAPCARRIALASARSTPSRGRSGGRHHEHAGPAMSLDQQYATGLSRRRIEDALLAAGMDLGDLQRGDLAPLEDFHTMGRIATSQLAELAEIERGDEVLDAGSGVGGTARYLAEWFGCRVTAVDLTEEYCNTSRWLNQLVGLDDQISVQQGDVTNLPFPSGSFNAVMSQHVQMNVADKTRLYDEARRVLRPRGRLAIWDITAGAPGAARLPPAVG